jgi:S-adenosylmethionine:tRNA ribosyltransferase-isomerase
LNYFCGTSKNRSFDRFQKYKISEFTYDLPDERIAKYPLPERDHSNLSGVEKGFPIKKDVFKNISDYLPADSMLVFNNTRVIHARLFFRKETGARIEVFCLEPMLSVRLPAGFSATGKSSLEMHGGQCKEMER